MNPKFVHCGQEYENMIEAELTSKLQDFGLSQSAAEVYIGLLMIGPSRASKICKIIRTSRTKGYKILENLKKTGFVSSTFSNPTIYSANSLQESLHSVINTKKFEVERLEKLMSYVAKNYETLKFKIKQTNSPQFSIISGRHNIYMYIEKMIKEAKEDLYVITTFGDLSKMYYTSIPESIRKAQQNGIKIKLVTDMKKDQSIGIIDRMEIDDFRIANLPSKGRIVSGQPETLVSGYTDVALGMNSEEDSALVTNSDEFVENMKCFSMLLWKAGKEQYSLKEKPVTRAD